MIKQSFHTKYSLVNGEHRNKNVKCKTNPKTNTKMKQREIMRVFIRGLQQLQRERESEASSSLLSSRLHHL